MTAIEALKQELIATQRKMIKIELGCGIVPRSRMYEYKGLIEYAKKIKEGIEWLEEMRKS